MKADIRHTLSESFGIEPDKIEKFLVDFMQGFTENAEALAAQLPAPDLLEVRRQTHTIIGYAATAGAMDLHTLAKELNAAAHVPSIPLVQELIRRIVALHAAYCAEE